jgi:hypothetical protein
MPKGCCCAARRHGTLGEARFFGVLRAQRRSQGETSYHPTSSHSLWHKESVWSLPPSDPIREVMFEFKDARNLPSPAGDLSCLRDLF